MHWPDGRWQPSRRRFPTVGGTLVRRTPLRSLFGGTYSQRGHYQLDERPTEPAQADWLLGAFLLMRRAMLDELGGWDGGFRHYGEDIDLSYRAFRGRVGAVVRAGSARHPRLRGGDRPHGFSPGTPGGTCAGWRDSCASIPSGCFGSASTDFVSRA